MEPIAIVGVGCIVPDALSPTAFWRNVLSGKVSLTDVPASRWDHSLYYDPNRSTPDKTYVRRGGFVEGFQVDWRKFKIPPADAEAVNPLQWMVLEAGFQALTGVNDLPTETTSVIIGATGLGWQRDSGLRIRLDDMVDAVRQSEEIKQLSAVEREAILEIALRTFKARLKEVSEDNVVGASASVAAGRINMHFDLKGPHSSVDAGFASSLAAVQLAVNGLRDREFDLAVTGGVSELLSPLELIAFSKLGALGANGIKPFDETADGTVLGEGAVLFTLRRLEDALAAKDTIYGLIRGIGGSSDGRGKSLVAPRTEGQALAMRRAFENAGPDVTPASIGSIECHATGTPVGDASEVRALAEVYGSAGKGRVALGSVKANIGHLRSGAGAAGLLKTVLSLHHRKIAPTPGITQVSSRLELQTTPFFVAQTEGEYPSGGVPRASVSAFSFGGNNFHAVLEAFEPAHAPRLATSGRKTFELEPLAIIGMGGMFPGADNVPQFWQRMVEGFDGTRPVPADRYPIENYYEKGSTRSDKSYTTLGCFLDKLPDPDASMRIPPAAWQAIDPSHVLCLRTADEALRDAKYAPGKWNNDRVAISLAFLPYQGKKFLADTRVNWNEFRADLSKAFAERGIGGAQRTTLLDAAEARYKKALPHITEDTLTGYLGSLNAGRIASLYDFHGPHFVVDAACASAHAALHAGWKLLAHGQADVVITGGVWCDMRPEFFIAACRFNALSANGSFPFDAKADGFIPGEGAGMLILKKLADAERDGDRIRGIVRTVQGSSDGKGRSVLAPSRAGEGLAMQRALKAASIAPASVDYVECHGTGTALGDVVEANAVGDSYSVGRAPGQARIGIGSVKSNIGHLNAAAGVAGLIKATLAVEAGVIPASIKCSVPNPKIPATVDVVSTLRQWASGIDGGPRRAGVSAFGVGGANYHAIVEQYRPSKPGDEPVRSSLSKPIPSQLLTFTGADLTQALAALDAHLAKGTFAQETAPAAAGTTRLALTAKSLDDAAKKAGLLRSAIKAGTGFEFLEQTGVFVGLPGSPLRRAKLALMFPGQGGQYANMLRPLAAAYPLVQATLDEADALYLKLEGRTLTGSFFTDDPEHFKQRDEDAHAAVFTVNVALARVLASLGLKPAMLIGQSAGELAGLVVAGALSLSDGLKAIASRTQAVLALKTADPGSMLALSCSSDEVPALLAKLPGFAALAADNGPKACIVSADSTARAALMARCTERGIECTQLEVSHGYHSELIAGARPAYQRTLEKLDFRELKTPLISTIDGKAYTGHTGLPAFLTSQFVKPVLLRQAFLTAHQAGVRVFLEAGPKWSLTQFARETLKSLPHGAMASIHPKIGELEQFHRLLAFCFVNDLAASASAPGAPVPRLAVVQTQPLDPSAKKAEQVLLAMPLADALPSNAARAMASALAARFGVDASAATSEDLSSFENIISLVERLVEDSSKSVNTSVAPVAERKSVDPKTLEQDVRRVLLANMVAKTGYPLEMLTEDLDLEADLGIDTVKQVDIFSKTREHFGVPRDPNLALRDFNTIRKVIAHIRDRVAAHQAANPPAAPPAPVVAKAPPLSSPSPAPAQKRSSGSGVAAKKPDAAAAFAAVQTALVAHAEEKTGYPVEMLGLDLDLEADLGIDTVKQVDIFAKAREQFEVPRDPLFVLRDYNTLRKYITYLVARLPAPAASPSGGSSPSGVARAPVETPAPSTSAGNVKETLFSMSLAELGLTETEKQKLSKALASRLGVSSPNVSAVTTLDELVRLMGRSGPAK